MENKISFALRLRVHYEESEINIGNFYLLLTWNHGFENVSTRTGRGSFDLFARPRCNILRVKINCSTNEDSNDDYTGKVPALVTFNNDVNNVMIT